MTATENTTAATIPAIVTVIKARNWLPMSSGLLFGAEAAARVSKVCGSWGVLASEIELKPQIFTRSLSRLSNERAFVPANGGIDQFDGVNHRPLVPGAP